MFQTLTEKLTSVFDRIRSGGVLNDAQIASAMRDIRISLLEADVALPVVREFIANVSEKATGQEIIKSVRPGQMIIKIINDEMIKLLESDEGESKLNLSDIPPANILLIGLQGSGKTTTAAKLGLRLKKEGKRILLVSLDTYRPAAQEQLRLLAQQIGVDSLEIIDGQGPIDITKRALKESRLSAYDVVIYDSAGRLHIDQEMISEITSISQMTKPTEKLLVVDAMIGQEAANISKSFDSAINITGVVLSRIDGDSKGGAALSIKHVTGKPIKFLGTGEKTEDFELFDAKSIVSRILGMGDVVSLVNQASELIDQKEAERTAKRLQKGKFDLNDYLSQIKNIRNIGGFSKIMNMIPGMSKLTSKFNNNQEGNDVIKMQEAIILSMTPKERRKPDILNALRKKRVADGSGNKIQDVNKLLKQYMQIHTMMKRIAKMGDKGMSMDSLMSQFGGGGSNGGGFPPGKFM